MYKKIVLWFKNIFGFSQKEINGFLVLSVIMLLSLFLPFFYSKSENYTQAESDKRILDSLHAQISKNKQEFELSKFEKYAKKEVNLFEFDPNTANEDQWKKLGISPKIAKRITNYVANGGRFRIKSDLKKIYGFSEKNYIQLEPYVLLPEKIDKYAHNSNSLASRTEVNTYKKYEEKQLQIDINACSAEELQEIRGIGVKLSERILKYRNALGGFVSMAQYKEVFGLDTSVVKKLEESTTIDLSKVNKIDINTIAEDSLAKHPYLTYKLSKTIINYRTQHGNFKNPEELKKIHSLDEKSYKKISPYIKIQ